MAGAHTSTRQFTSGSLLLGVHCTVYILDFSNGNLDSTFIALQENADSILHGAHNSLVHSMRGRWEFAGCFRLKAYVCHTLLTKCRCMNILPAESFVGG